MSCSYGCSFIKDHFKSNDQNKSDEQQQQKQPEPIPVSPQHS